MNESDVEQYSILPEDKLAELAQTGHDDAFDELVNRYEHRLYQMALAILSSSHKAEKAVLETLKKARENLHEYKGESLLLTWLYRRLQKYILTHYEMPHDGLPAREIIAPEEE